MLLCKMLERNKTFKESSKSRGIEPKQESMMQYFCEYTQGLTIFAIKDPLQMFDWVICKPSKVLKYSK